MHLWRFTHLKLEINTIFSKWTLNLTYAARLLQYLSRDYNSLLLKHFSGHIKVNIFNNIANLPYELLYKKQVHSEPKMRQRGRSVEAFRVVVSDKFLQCGVSIFWRIFNSLTEQLLDGSNCSRRRLVVKICPKKACDRRSWNFSVH